MAVSLRSLRTSAEVLGVSIFTIRRLIAGGQIRAVNIGSRVMISEAELERVASQGVGSRRARKPNRSSGH
jgi:excisionase family DNA binding protein